MAEHAGVLIIRSGGLIFLDDTRSGFPAPARSQTGVWEREGGLEQDPHREWRSEGVRSEEVKGETMRRLEPALGPELTVAYFLPELAQVRNPRHLQALLSYCQGRGVRLRPGFPVLGFDRQGSRITAVRTSSGSLSAERYLLTAGAWTSGLLEPLGWRPGIRPVRGQIALLQTGRPLFHRILLRGKRYLVPLPDGR